MFFRSLKQPTKEAILKKKTLRAAFLLHKKDFLELYKDTNKDLKLTKDKWRNYINNPKLRQKANEILATMDLALLDVIALAEDETAFGKFIKTETEGIFEASPFYFRAFPLQPQDPEKRLLQIALHAAIVAFNHMMFTELRGRSDFIIHKYYPETMNADFAYQRV